MNFSLDRITKEKDNSEFKSVENVAINKELPFPTGNSF